MSAPTAPVDLTIRVPLTAEQAREAAAWALVMVGLDLTPAYVAGAVTALAWERARRERWYERRDPELPLTAWAREAPELAGEGGLEDYRQAWRDIATRVGEVTRSG